MSLLQHETAEYPIVAVSWVDSHRIDSWSTPEMIERLLVDTGQLDIKSVGYLVAESLDVVVLATSINTDGGAISPIAIPRAAITSLLTIEEAIVA